MMQARNVGEMLDVVTAQWPAILAVDHVALALIVDGEAYLATHETTARIELRLAKRVMRGLPMVQFREVERGHSLFGRNSGTVSAEALIAVECGPGLPNGLLLLGQEKPCPIDDRHGAQLLRFLGEALAAMIAGWLRAPKT